MWNPKYNKPRIEARRRRRLEKRQKIMARYSQCKEPALVSYAAGLLDGKGCILINKHGTVYTLQVRVGMSSDKAVSLMHKTFGGSLKINSFTHMHTWVLCSMEAEGFLRAVLPFLHVKEEEARVALAFREHILETRREKQSTPLRAFAVREAYRLKLQELKHGKKR